MRKKKSHQRRGVTGRTLVLILLVMAGIFSFISAALPRVGITNMKSVWMIRRPFLLLVPMAK